MIARKYYSFVLCAMGILVALYDPQFIISSVKSGMYLCYNTVIPSLFVLMVLTLYMGQHHFIPILSLPLMWYSRLLKINDKKFPAYLLLSLLGGFANGAIFLNELKKSGYTENTLKTISPVMINNSFAFCIFAVGAGMLDNVYTGYLLYISLITSSLITSFFLSFIHKYNIVSKTTNSLYKPKSLVECINQAVNSIISICGFVIIFFVICKAINLYISSKMFKSLLFIFSEVTIGCTEIALTTGENQLFICIALSIFPVCTLCQVYNFTHDKNIIYALISSRIVHTPIAMALFNLLCNIFPVVSSTATTSHVVVRYFYNCSEISSVLFLLVLAFAFSFDKNKLFTKIEK